MSCAGKGYGTNPQSNDYLIAHFYSLSNTTTNNSVTINGATINGTTNSIINGSKSTRKCRQLNRSFYPSFTPNLTNLSVTTSASGAYSLVHIHGSNFLPNGTTFIQFGTFGYFPAIYYSSFTLSFVVPLNAVPGTYPVKVVNLYNGNFSPPVNQSYTGNLNFSQPINYTIT